jgi:hypothetical protein
VLLALVLLALVLLALQRRQFLDGFDSLWPEARRQVTDLVSSLAPESA